MPSMKYPRSGAGVAVLNQVLLQVQELIVQMNYIYLI